MDLLEPYNKSLLEATRFYIAHLERTSRSCTLEELTKRFIEYKRNLGLSPKHLSMIYRRGWSVWRRFFPAGL